MILKEKQFKPQTDPLRKAGDEAEKQMAFYLRREFGKAKDVFVINDLRIVHEGETAQMDHLLVTRYGLFIIESKSIHATVVFNQHGDWIRIFENEKRGMPSPIRQAEAQGKIVKELMRANSEELLDTLLGMQKGFRYCPIEIRVAISDSGIIERGCDEPRVLKADMAPESISRRLKEMKSSCNPFSSKSLLSFNLDPGWSMKQEEAKRVAHFLVACHTPLTRGEVDKAGENPETVPQPAFVPRVGGICPKCKNKPLERGSIKRMDGTETDYLRCPGCDAIFPLVALTLSSTKEEITLTLPRKTTTEEHQPKYKAEDTCPLCKNGKLRHCKGRKGLPDFLGCSNYYSKPSCGFQGQMNNSERPG